MGEIISMKDDLISIEFDDFISLISLYMKNCLRIYIKHLRACFTGDTSQNFV